MKTLLFSHIKKIVTTLIGISKKFPFDKLVSYGTGIAHLQHHLKQYLVKVATIASSFPPKLVKKQSAVIDFKMQAINRNKGSSSSAATACHVLFR